MKTVTLSIEEWSRRAKQGEKIPAEITLAGTSMQPLIRKGRDVITILPPEEPFKVGDIVLFQRPDGVYVVHRIWRIEGDQIITLGDNCENPDPPLKETQILGKVVRIRRGRRVIETDSAGQQRYGRVWMKLLPIRKRVLHYKFVLKKNLGIIKQ